MGRLLDIAKAALEEAETQYFRAQEHQAAVPPEQEKPGDVAACGSPHCAGCYEVEPGVWIHPPKSGEDWKEWLLKWKPKGKVQ